MVAGPDEVAVMLIHLDDLKHVNDSRGHLAGDALLPRVTGPDEARAIAVAVRQRLLEPVAEAVESEHAEWALRHGIELAEGYRFAEPMAPELTGLWLEAREGATPRVVDGMVDAGAERV